MGLHAELEDGSLAVGPPLDELKDQAAAARRKASAGAASAASPGTARSAGWSVRRAPR